MSPLSRRSIPTLAWLTLTALGAVPATARAQAAPERTRPAQIVAINPFGLVLDYYYAEYERAFSGSSSGGVSGSYFELDEYHFLSFDARYRLYPSERAPEGFAVSATVGFSRVTDTDPGCGVFIGGVCQDQPRPDQRGNAITTGIQLDYTWLLGSQKRFAVGVGVGAKRLHYTSDRPGDAPKTVPTARFTIGRAF